MTKNFTSYVVLLLLACNIISISASAKWDKLSNILTPFPANGRWGAHVFTSGNKIFVGGGYTGNNNNLNDLICFDISSKTWSNKNDLPGTVANRSGGVSFTINGKTYLGLGIENFNNFTATWAFLTDLWEYDEANDTWTSKASFPGQGLGFAGSFIIDNKFYVVGGTTGKLTADGTNEVYEYDPATDKWTQKADFPGSIIKDNPFGFSINGKGYIVGGSTASGTTNKTYEYDPASDIWTEKATYPEQKINGGISFVVNGTAYCGLGGLGSSQYLEHFWSYNPTNDAWSYAGGYEFNNQGRMWSIVTAVDNKIYMGAGWRIDGSNQTFFNDWYTLDPQEALTIATANASNNTLIYPNPAINTIHVKESSYKEYSIHELNGRVLRTGSISNSGAIDISTVPTGYYLLKLNGTNIKHMQPLNIIK